MTIALFVSDHIVLDALNQKLLLSHKQIHHLHMCVSPFFITANRKSRASPGSIFFQRILWIFDNILQISEHLI